MTERTVGIERAVNAESTESGERERRRMRPGDYETYVTLAEADALVGDVDAGLTYQRVREMMQAIERETMEALMVGSPGPRLEPLREPQPRALALGGLR
jgi:hypothetical protein